MIVAKVREDKNKQRRITIPIEDKILKDGDLVEIKKLEFKIEDKNGSNRRI